MELPEFDLLLPSSLREACRSLAEHREKALLLAGGTALLVALRYGLRRPAVLVGLKKLTELNYVSQDSSGGLSVGSMTTLHTLERSLVKLDGFSPLARVIQLIAAPPIRNQATIGGNLCLDTRCIYYNQSGFWRSGQKACFKLGGFLCHAVEKGRRCQAVYQGDLAPALIALGAEIKIRSEKGERQVPLAQFYTGRGEKPNILEPGEILVEVRLPSPGNRTSLSYEKLRVREGIDFPMAGVAVLIKRDETGTIRHAKMVLGALGPSPLEVPEATELLAGQEPTEDLLRRLAQEALKRVQPVGNLVIDTNYRRKAAEVLARRALRRALSMVS